MESNLRIFLICAFAIGQYSAGPPSPSGPGFFKPTESHYDHCLFKCEKCPKDDPKFTICVVKPEKREFPCACRLDYAICNKTLPETLTLYEGKCNNPVYETLHIQHTYNSPYNKYPCATPRVDCYDHTFPTWWYSPPKNRETLEHVTEFTKYSEARRKLGVHHRPNNQPGSNHYYLEDGSVGTVRRGYIGGIPWYPEELGKRIYKRASGKSFSPLFDAEELKKIQCQLFFKSDRNFGDNNKNTHFQCNTADQAKIENL